MNSPITFAPLFMERVWGGRRLESLFGKMLPPAVPIGESWEIVDREEAQSVVRDGPLAGKTLHELWTNERAGIFGNVAASPRFPLLLKLLDAEEKLSVQVHPPPQIAELLGGEPKTEMWYIMDARPGAGIYAGLPKEVTREDFERALETGEVAEKIHRIPVQTGQSIFIPSGRIHALGAGNVICEVQQNSDTTYRVFDWNRVGLDGKPRALHIEESMKSIDFADVEPAMESPRGELVVECEFFRVEKWDLKASRPAVGNGRFSIFTCLTGSLRCGETHFAKGDFFLIPACATALTIEPLEKNTTVLRTTVPR